MIKPREATIGSDVAFDIRGEIVAVCEWSRENGVLLVMSCPSGDWPKDKDLDKMALEVLRRAGISRTQLKVKKIPEEYFGKSGLRFFESA